MSGAHTKDNYVVRVRRWHCGQWDSLRTGLWDSSQNLLYIFSIGLRHLPPTTPPLSHPSVSGSCTRACECKLVITTLRKPDQPIATGLDFPVRSLWWICITALMNKASPRKWISKLTSYSIAGRNGPLSLPNSYRTRASLPPFYCQSPGSGPVWWIYLTHHLDRGWGIE
jgi:hypothetical protein